MAAPGARPDLAARLGAELSAKVAVLLGLTVGICVPYFWLQRAEALPVRLATPVDAWVGFDPSWVTVYLSIALLVPASPLLARCRDELARYAKGLALLCGVSFLVFLLYPVAGPRPEAVPDHAIYRWLVSQDRPLNSLPSLHAGLTVYSFLFGYRVLRGDLGRAGRRAFAGVAGVWTALILYATLAIKQHWAVDLPPGILVAWIADRLAWRDA